MINLQIIHDFAIEVAKKAGLKILQASETRFANSECDISHKCNSIDLVTKADRDVEEIVRRAIQEKFPDHRFIGEESLQRERLGDLPTWIVDPIDGTTNFVHGIRDVSISIGFTIDACPVVGVVLNPFTSRMYTAIKGRGSYESILSRDFEEVIARHKLPVLPVVPLSLGKSVVATSIGTDRTKNLSVKTRTWHRLLSAEGGMIRGIRIFQSSALEMCAVACGSLDCFWGGGQKEWDICAGWVIVNEAGGIVAGGNAPLHHDGFENIEEPSLDGKLLLAVRQGQTRDEMNTFVRNFWGMIDGRLDYSE